MTLIHKIFDLVGFAYPPRKSAHLSELNSSFDFERKGLDGTVVESFSEPQGVTEEVLQYFRRHAQKAVDSMQIRKVENVRLLPDGLVLANCGATLIDDVSAPFGRADAPHPILGRRRPFKNPRELPIEIGIAASQGAFNYFHFIFDALPKVLELLKFEKTPILVQCNLQFQRDVLNAAAPNVQFIDANSHFAMKTATLVLNPEPWCRKAVCQSIASLIPQTGKELPSYGDRIYVSRRFGTGRKLAAERELIPLLSKRGFRILELESMTFKEQVGAFRNAKIVIAPHGAGLTNILFCQPGTRVLELAHRRYCHLCFWQVSCMMKLKYQILVSPGPEPIEFNVDFCRQDILLTPKDILGALDLELPT